MKLTCGCGAYADGTYAYWYRRGGDADRRIFDGYETCVRIWIKDGTIMSTEAVYGGAPQPHECIDCRHARNRQREAAYQRELDAAHKEKIEKAKLRGPWYKRIFGSK
jgi:hypothetical protein